MNLCLNARDAIQGEGKIFIRTENVELSTDELRSLPGLSQPAVVHIRVSDSGSGMAADILPHIFEPFFTTKEKGRGTGLGLSTVYGIVKGHCGEIKVHSATGEGTTFDIYFPVLIEPEAIIDSEKINSVMGGDEKILLIDDEEDILELSKMMLEKFGYKVITAESGERGVEIFEDKDGNFDLVIIDLIMSDMDGKKCAEHIRAFKPEATILLSSGLLPDQKKGEDLTSLVNGFLRKPYSLPVLMKKVRETIDKVNAKIKKKK